MIDPFNTMYINNPFSDLRAPLAEDYLTWKPGKKRNNAKAKKEAFDKRVAARRRKRKRNRQRQRR